MFLTQGKEILFCGRELDILHHTITIIILFRILDVNHFDYKSQIR